MAPLERGWDPEFSAMSQFVGISRDDIRRGSLFIRKAILGTSIVARELEKNIGKIYLINIFYTFMLIAPIIVLFFQENGLTMEQVLIIQSVFSIIVVLFEIPSGYFADYIGRKTSIIIGCLFSFLGYLLYSILSGFWGFLTAEIFLGVGLSFLSGADSALLYDSLLAMKRESEYAKFEGRVSSFNRFSESSATILGGLLAAVSLRLPFVVETVILFGSIPIAMSLYDPFPRKGHGQENQVRDLWNVVRFCLHENRQCAWLIFYSSFISASTLVMFWFTQPYLKQAGVPVSLFGIVFCVLTLFCGSVSYFADRIERSIGKNILLCGLFVLPCLGFFLLGSSRSWVMMACLLLFYFTRGITVPIFKTYVNELVDSANRATTLSVNSMIGRLIFAVGAPLFGRCADKVSLQASLYCAGVVFCLVGAGSVLMLVKHRVIVAGTVEPMILGQKMGNT